MRAAACVALQIAASESLSESVSETSSSVVGTAKRSEIVCIALNPETSVAPSFTLRVSRCDVKEVSARKPDMPLCPLEEAKSAGVLPSGYSADGSVNAPGDAPRETRAATVSSLLNKKKMLRNEQKKSQNYYFYVHKIKNLWTTFQPASIMEIHNQCQNLIHQKQVERTFRQF